VQRNRAGERLWCVQEPLILSRSEGERLDFDSYVARHGRELIRLAFVLTGDNADAQDIVQEALSRAYPRWERIAPLEDVHAYVRRMVINARTSWWRRTRRREVPVAEVHPERGEPSAETVVEDEALWRACLALPHDQRNSVVLRYYEGLSYAEIASLTECAEATARSRVFRGLETLRSAFGEEER